MLDPKKTNILSLSVQFYGPVKKLFKVKKENFLPQPKVESAFIKIGPIKPYDLKIENEYFRNIKVGFKEKRKKLKNNLASGLHLDKEIVLNIFKDLNISENARAQELDFNTWIALTKKLKTL